MIVAQLGGSHRLHAVVASAASLPAVVDRTLCGLQIGSGYWGVYESRNQKITCSECIEKETDMTTVEETTHADTMPPEAVETNGHTPKSMRATKTRLDRAMDFLAKVDDQEEDRKRHIEAVEQDINAMQGVLARLKGTTPEAIASTQRAHALIRKADELIARNKAERSKRESSKPGRKPRENSVPSKVYAILEDAGPSTAEYVANSLKLEPKLVHSGLHQLLKAGKVKSKGSRRNRVWSLK